MSVNSTGNMVMYSISMTLCHDIVSLANHFAFNRQIYWYMLTIAPVQLIE